MFPPFHELVATDGRAEHEPGRLPLARALAITALAGAFQGAALGSLGERPLAIAYTACKVPLLLTVTTLVCLPSYYVLLAVLGLQRDFRTAVRAIVFAQAGAALVLGSLAPVTAFFHATRIPYPAALWLATTTFATAALAGRAVLARHMRPLVDRDRRHARALSGWFLLHAFVAVKFAWVLRPFVGDPALAVTFLREQRWYENPYTSLLWGAIGMLRSMAFRLSGG